MPDRSRPVAALIAPSAPSPIAPSPFTALPPGTVLARSPKRLLVEVSKHLEREAMRIGETAVVTAAFQHARFFTPATTARYRDLAERGRVRVRAGRGHGGRPRRRGARGGRAP